MIGILLALVGSVQASEPPPKIDAPIETGVRRSVDAAVVVGNEVYAYLPKVDFAERDAEVAYQTFLDTRGLLPENVGHLTGANRDQILDAVKRANAQVMDGGTVWVYFAGHGAASPSTGELMLVGDDAKQEPDVFASRSLSVGEIADAVEAPVVFVLDTCYAGFSRSGEQLIPGTRFAVPPNVEFGRPWPVTLWTAAGPDQISGPYGAARHGLFTYFAMGALRGWADGELGERDDAVSLGEAQQYVARAMTTLQVTNQAPALTTDDDQLVLSVGKGLERGPRLEALVRPTMVEVDEQVGVAKSPIPPVAEQYAWPITHMSGGTFEDAYNVEMKLRGDLMTIAGYDQDGRAALKRYRGGARHAALIPVGLVAGYATYLMAWDYKTGHNFHATASGAGAGAAGALVVGALVLETRWIIRRSQNRDHILEAANRVVQGEAR